MAASGSESQQTASSYGARAVWLVISLLLFYPLSAGPFVFFFTLAEKLGWTSLDSALGAFAIIYMPLEMLVMEFEIVRAPIIGYVEFWEWIADCFV